MRCALVLGLAEEVGGEDGGDDVAADGAGFFIDEETAVGIAIEADAEVGAGLGDLGLEHVEVGIDERVGLVNEGAVDLE